MPLYTVTTQAGVLSGEGKARLAGRCSYQLATPGAPPRRRARSH
jgi:hypothetical protein